MPDIPDHPTPSQAQEALRVLTDDSVGGEALQRALAVLAETPVLIPVVDPRHHERKNGDPRALVLPVLDQADGSQQVPVFTSEERLGEALPSVLSYRLVPLGRLATDWPDEELQLVIDPGNSDVLTLTAEGIHTLLVRH
ncbi:SseB family protein [Streptomyces sporangiiformans]|uniref:SseB family protein n=1 Tax=Streptomyces sporangiiformans TaxID=2315329 RepID=A0A505DR37_9ACTN|nr:SseB family protein [Streptomyces sporangiiformans]TPQ23572.1 SseB family protein [Streptomyces sporangiiformans]